MGNVVFVTNNPSNNEKCYAFCTFTFENNEFSVQTRKGKSFLIKLHIGGRLWKDSAIPVGSKCPKKVGWYVFFEE